MLLYFWLQVEGVKPDQWDLLGATICLVGTMIILFAPHRNPV
ncbi:YnfA family protein [Planktothrix mougeotii]